MIKNSKKARKTPSPPDKVARKTISNNERWHRMWRAYMDYIDTHHRCPSKYHEEDMKLVNWAKNCRKLRNRGDLTGLRLELFAELSLKAAEFRRRNQYMYQSGAAFVAPLCDLPAPGSGKKGSGSD